MEEKYSIKGIEKIIEKAGKERLAKHYDVDINADFVSIITEDFKNRNIPNGLEVAFYYSLTPEEYNKVKRGENREVSLDPQKEAAKIHKQDERKRAMFGINYMGSLPEFGEGLQIIGGTYGDELYFFVDEPIKESMIQRISPAPPRKFCGGAHYYNLIMGNKYYKEHKDEFDNAIPDRSGEKALESYLNNFMDEFENVEYRGGYGPRGEYQETEKIKEEKAKNEEIILKLTGKSSIDELSLRDFISLKRRLEQEEKQLKEEFANKFTKKNEEGRE